MVMCNSGQAPVRFPVQPWCNRPALARGDAGSGGSRRGAVWKQCKLLLSASCVLVPPRPWLQGRWLAEVRCWGALQQATRVRCQETGSCLFARQWWTWWVSRLLSSDFTSQGEGALEEPQTSSCSSRARVLHESLLFWCSYLWPFGAEKATFAFWIGVNTCSAVGNHAAGLCSRDRLLFRWLLWPFWGKIFLDIVTKRNANWH